MLRNLSVVVMLNYSRIVLGTFQNILLAAMEKITHKKGKYWNKAWHRLVRGSLKLMTARRQILKHALQMQEKQAEEPEQQMEA